ncbi:hypothetical protein NDU88_007640 [Pleurodeles waltl]|uniref:Uncharacterized protein n=1 Tax=Pleurodeles waltl TaxID=8319 RepID=A0AAV7QPE2_PLEWA|nr:hypothetical protein NDU88_007640 [Pleurodeles waltl]
MSGKGGRLAQQNMQSLRSHCAETETASPDPEPDSKTTMSEPTLKEIMPAIQIIEGPLEPKTDSIEVKMSLLRADVNKVNERVKDIESKLTEIRGSTDTLEQQADYLQQDNALIQTKLEDMEERSRWNKICLMGVPWRAYRLGLEVF